MEGPLVKVHFECCVSSLMASTYILKNWEESPGNEVTHHRTNREPGKEV